MSDVEADFADRKNGKLSKEEHKLKSLKYHLLGPSLTKAGQDRVDQSKVQFPNIPVTLRQLCVNRYGQ